MTDPRDLVTVYATAANEAEAKKLARALVEERLAACVNLLPIHSVYRWEGKVEEGAEYALLVKTRAALAERAVARLKALHSYEVPCAVVWPWAGALEPYAAWVERETR